MAAVQGRKKGKRKATATMVVDDPEHILLDRKVSCSTARTRSNPDYRIILGQPWPLSGMGEPMLVLCGHHTYLCICQLA